MSVLVIKSRVQFSEEMANARDSAYNEKSSE